MTLYTFRHLPQSVFLRIRFWLLIWMMKCQPLGRHFSITILRKLNSGWNIGNCEVFFFSIGSLSGTDCGNIMQWGNISILNAKTSTSTFSRVYYFSCRSFPNVFDIALSSTVAYLVMQKNSGRISFSALHHRPSHHFSQYQTRCTILDYRKIPVCFQFQQTFERNLHFAETLPEFCKSSTHCQL